MSTKTFSWLHIPGMLQWVENKEESNQGAINTRLLYVGGFGRVVTSLWIHQLFAVSSCWLGILNDHSGTKTKRSWQRWADRGGRRGWCYDWALSCSTNISLFWVQLLGGPRRPIFQVSSDRLTTSTVEVFHSQTEAACWLCYRGSR